MKKLVTLLALFLVGNILLAQDNEEYLIFEFMKVDNEQQSDYGEVEAFWEKIHAQRVKNGDIVGWDLWALGPGGEDQGFQYLTVTVHKDPVSMFKGPGNFAETVQAAYPDMTPEEMTKKMDKTAKSRDLAVRIYLQSVNQTEGEFDMPIGTVASIDLMKVNLGSYSAYEKAESEVFKPDHQRQVDADLKESWSLLRFMSPIGSDTYASHITVNMYRDYDQVFKSRADDGPEPTAEQMKAMQDGLATRDMKFVYMANLIRKVR